jgi:hypothetical protein
MCELDNFETIFGNMFLDAYHVDVLKNNFKLKIKTRLSKKLINLKVEYHANLKVINVHFVFLQKLQHILLFIFMYVNKFNVKVKTKGVSLWPICISNMFNTILIVLTNKFPNELLCCCDVDHKI